MRYTLNRNTMPHSLKELTLEDITVVCAWCGLIKKQGGPNLSHGICDECATEELLKLEFITK